MVVQWILRQPGIKWSACRYVCWRVIQRSIATSDRGATALCKHISTNTLSAGEQQMANDARRAQLCIPCVRYLDGPHNMTECIMIMVVVEYVSEEQGNALFAHFDSLGRYTLQVVVSQLHKLKP
jgi:hypothetical protein